MLSSLIVKSIRASPLQARPALLQNLRTYASHGPSSNDNDPKDFQEAREWFSRFNGATIPAKAAKTSFSRSSGPGGQKTNKTSSKATTVWPIASLERHVPSVILSELQNSSYFVSSSKSISIQCDSHRSQSDNEAETHTRLHNEIKRIYKAKVPGVTSPEQAKKVEQLMSVPAGGWRDYYKKNKMDSNAVKRMKHQFRLDTTERRIINRLSTESKDRKR